MKIIDFIILILHKSNCIKCLKELVLKDIIVLILWPNNICVLNKYFFISINISFLLNLQWIALRYFQKYKKFKLKHTLHLIKIFNQISILNYKLDGKIKKTKTKKNTTTANIVTQGCSLSYLSVYKSFNILESCNMIWFVR